MAVVEWRVVIIKCLLIAAGLVFRTQFGKTYGYFDIGDGIKAGETETLTWDKSTNSQSCHQWFKAVWESGEEGKPVKFDFCEKDLTLSSEHFIGRPRPHRRD